MTICDMIYKEKDGRYYQILFASDNANDFAYHSNTTSTTFLNYALLFDHS